MSVDMRIVGEWMTDHGDILRLLQNRLHAAVAQSPLLRIPDGRQSRLLDVLRLDELGPGLATRLSETIVGRRQPLAINFTGRGPAVAPAPVNRSGADVRRLSSARQALAEVVTRFGHAVTGEPARCRGLLLDFCPDGRREVNLLYSAAKLGLPGELAARAAHLPLNVLISSLANRLRDDQGIDERLARWSMEAWASALGLTSPTPTTEEPKVEPEAEATVADPEVANGLYDLIERRIHRHAELARRETGTQALWFGYPMFIMRSRDGSQVLRAPLILWPATVTVSGSGGKRLTIGLEDGGEPTANTLLAAHVRRVADGPDLAGALGDVVGDPSLLVSGSLDTALARVAASLGITASPTLVEPLQPLPAVPRIAGHALVNAAVFGYFRWPNQALLADLESLARGTVSLGLAERIVKPAVGESIDAAVPAPPEQDRYLVSESDPSQAAAVWQARDDRGLVLHGPPGTGKSQAIVNIIADALARGRTVLMACQKQAATHVVIERLRAAGLAGLCIEVHDPEGDRQKVFSEIRNQVESLPTSPAEVSVGQVERDREQLSTQIESLERELDGRAAALGTPHPTLGLTYEEAVRTHTEVRAAEPYLEPSAELRSACRSFTPAQLNQLLSIVQEAGRLFHLAGVRVNFWSRPARDAGRIASSAAAVAAALKRLRDADSRHLQFLATHPASRSPSSDREANELVGEGPGFVTLFTKTVAGLSKPDRQLVRAWLIGFTKGLVPTAAAAAVTAAKDSVEAAAVDRPNSAWSEVLAGSDPERVGQLKALAKRLLTYRNRRLLFLRRSYQSAASTFRKSAPDSVATTTDAQLWAAADEVLRHFDAVDRWACVRQLNGQLVPQAALRSDDPDKHSQFPAWAGRCLDVATLVWSYAQRFPWARPCIEAFLRGTGPNEQDINLLQSTIRRVSVLADMFLALKELSQWIPSELAARARAVVTAGRSINELFDRADADLSRIDALAAWESFEERQEPSTGRVVAALVVYEGAVESTKAGLRDRPPGERWAGLIRIASASEWKSLIELADPRITAAHPADHERKTAMLGKLLEQKRGLEAGCIRSRWLTKQFPLRRHPWKRVFQLRSSKNGEAKRLREAVGVGLPLKLLSLRPCWLTSPAAAAELFPLQPGLFDVVIFDEASQCPLEQAIPILARGRTAVISGDEKQLPPTSFFSARVEDDADELEPNPGSTAEDIVATLHASALREAEDLLQVSIGNFPERHLRVHYRSESPDLIQFSNWAFYGGQLEMPPPSTAAATSGIDYVHVGGTYEARTNLDEARRVVETLRELWRSTPMSAGSDTFGIVTFNQPQRELILDLLDSATSGDRDFARRYADETARRENGKDVGLFVKNLENVQGDERDVIIFSTTFGPDRQGKFSRRYGPVGSLGGERRLNVAITRARRKIVVMSSMPVAQVADALSGSDVGAVGVTPAGYLQLYLAYAEAVGNGNGSSILDRFRTGNVFGSDGRDRSSLRDDVRATLICNGYSVDDGGGAGGLAIDLIVRRAGWRAGQVLGIDCGGLGRLGWSSRYADVWRSDLLRRRSWQLHRIWPHRWWADRGAEVERLDEMAGRLGLDEVDNSEWKANGKHDPEVILRCLHCNRRNRVAASRLNDGPVCGTCRQLLPTT